MKEYMVLDKRKYLPSKNYSECEQFILNEMTFLSEDILMPLSDKFFFISIQDDKNLAPWRITRYDYLKETNGNPNNMIMHLALQNSKCDFYKLELVECIFNRTATDIVFVSRIGNHFDVIHISSLVEGYGRDTVKKFYGKNKANLLDKAKKYVSTLNPKLELVVSLYGDKNIYPKFLVDFEKVQVGKEKEELKDAEFVE